MIIVNSLPNQANDPNGPSILNNSSFNVGLTVTDIYGNPVYNAEVTIYAFTTDTGSSFVIGSGSTGYDGTATISCSALQGVSGTSSSRSIAIEDNYGDRDLENLNFWFPVTMTVECPNDTVSSPGYETTNPSHYPSCGKITQETAFVALPAGGICNKQVKVRSLVTGQFVTVPVKDTGPYNTNNPYWNGSGVPSNTQNNNVGIDGSDVTWNDLDLGRYYSCSYGSPSGNTQVQWRFA